MARAVGQSEPTADEKDPTFLAVQVRALRTSIDQLMETQKTNLETIYHALTLTDIHLQVTQRMLMDVTRTFTKGRSVVDDGINVVHDVLVQVTDEGELDFTGYYKLHQQVVELAGPQLAGLAGSLWARGLSAEEAVQRAKFLRKEAETPNEAVGEAEYDDEFFGGTNGKDNHEQVETSAQASG